MKINDLEFFSIQMGRTDGGKPVRSLLICVTTDSGLCGWGESRLAWRPDELPERRNRLLPTLAGMSVFEIEEIVRLEVLDCPMLSATVETACWDLVGRITGVPICRLWGGCFRGRIPTVVELPGSDAEQTIRFARETADHGYHRQILRSTGRVESDLGLIERVCEAVGPRGEILLDARGGFTMDQARQLCRDVPEQRLTGLIDPLDDASPHSITTLARQTDVPLMIGRSIRSPRDVFLLGRSDVRLSVVIDPQRVGGMLAARRCAAVADAARLPVSLGGEATLGIASAAMLQLAAVMPSFAGGNRCDYRQLKDDVLVEPFEVIDGMISVPQSPGLGIEVDRRKVERA